MGFCKRDWCLCVTVLCHLFLFPTLLSVHIQCLIFSSSFLSSVLNDLRSVSQHFLSVHRICIHLCVFCVFCVPFSVAICLSLGRDAVSWRMYWRICCFFCKSSAGFCKHDWTLCVTVLDHLCTDFHYSVNMFLILFILHFNIECFVLYLSTFLLVFTPHLYQFCVLGVPLYSFSVAMYRFLAHDVASLANMYYWRMCSL